VTITIRATSLSDDPAAGINYDTYIVRYFADLTNTGYTFYGGTPDVFNGQTYYMNGVQVGFEYGTKSGDSSPRQVILGGDEVAYDFIHHGMQYGHGISGEVDSLTFGDWTDDTKVGDDGLIEDFLSELEISGLNLSAEPGAGPVPTNAVFQLFVALQSGDADALQDLLSAEAQTFVGSDGNDRYTGTEFGDTAKGGKGDDKLFGGAGDDTLIGGLGRDKMAGGEGDDLFVFQGRKQSGSEIGARDVIKDFADGDLIDLSRIDAVGGKNGDQSFTFIGEASFSGEAGELAVRIGSGSTKVLADINGDGHADFAIRLVGEIALDADDFVL
jgi:Ca2+-binding RTX toxin-like protein